MSAPTSLRPKWSMSPSWVWTVADLHRKFGSIAFDRLRQAPPSGCGRMADAVRIPDQEDQRYEMFGVPGPPAVGEVKQPGGLPSGKKGGRRSR